LWVEELLEEEEEEDVLSISSWENNRFAIDSIRGTHREELRENQSL
tara:strand:+ start:874 stop:1011 length:138 start_codon:yes stop_codon:yes gene_type:complete